MRLDLHGFTVHSGWEAYRKTTKSHYDNYIKKLVVITGQGQMNTEITGWVSVDPYATSATQISSGAWEITIVNKSKRDRVAEEKKAATVAAGANGIYASKISQADLIKLAKKYKVTPSK